VFFKVDIGTFKLGCLWSNFSYVLFVWDSYGQHREEGSQKIPSVAWRYYPSKQQCLPAHFLVDDWVRACQYYQCFQYNEPSPTTETHDWCIGGKVPTSWSTSPPTMIRLILSYLQQSWLKEFSIGRNSWRGNNWIDTEPNGSGGNWLPSLYRWVGSLG